MRSFLDQSIRRKLIAILMLVSTAALLLACSAFIVYELLLYRTTTSREMQTIAHIVSESVTAALAFGDARSARETLGVLRADSRILRARLYNDSGGLFAAYSPSGVPADAPPLRPDGAYFGPGRLELYRGVLLEGEKVGTVYLETDLGQMYLRLWRYAGIMAAVLVACCFLAFLISSVLQRFVSEPLLRLAGTASRVSNEGNYSLRAVKTTRDELGTLVDRFNEMMEQIHSRDVELQTTHDQLEERVRQRTRELEAEIAQRRRTQQELLVAKESAEESNRAKSAFLANMSHELRTPLNAIVGYSEMLEEDALAAGQTGCASDLAKILTAARQLLGLISDVLDLSKIEAGKMKVVLEPVDIGALADEVAATVEPLTKKNGNVFEFRREDFQGVMYTDGGKLRQVLLNLLSNACKFTSNGNIALRITRRELNGREWTDWHVSDSGIGIAPEDLQKLFQAFTQVDASATRRHGGTGLGLAISQRFCQMLGGRISVESSPGKGSTFTLQLPVDSGTRPDRQEESQPEALTLLHRALAAGGKPDDNRSAGHQGFLDKGEKVPRDA